MKSTFFRNCRIAEGRQRLISAEGVVLSVMPQCEIRTRSLLSTG